MSICDNCFIAENGVIEQPVSVVVLICSIARYGYAKWTYNVHIYIYIYIYIYRI